MLKFHSLARDSTQKWDNNNITVTHCLGTMRGLMNDNYLHNYLCKHQVIMDISKWIHKETITLFEHGIVTPFKWYTCSKTWDQVDATEYSVNWDNGSSSVSFLHWSWHLIHMVIPIWHGWDRVEPFNISKMVWGSNVHGWEYIVDVFPGYLKYNMDLGNMDIWGFKLNNFEMLATLNHYTFWPCALNNNGIKLWRNDLPTWVH